MTLPVYLGEVLDGKYRVERVLGEGGMGIVVAATHLDLDQPVALKFLRLEEGCDGPTLKRFLREARATAKLKSEHVVRVLDVGRLEGGMPYLVMECLEGTDFNRIAGPLEASQAIAYLRQACVAVAEAHSHGIVHRDLKLSNLFLARRADGSSTVKVLDFGISKQMATAQNPDAGLTETGASMGTPSYMSPEQMRSSRDVDGRTDIWALGAILFRLVSGRVPFEAQTAMDLAVKVAQDPVPRLDDLRPGLPPGLSDVVQKCLEKDRERRYATVSELADALAELAPVQGNAPGSPPTLFDARRPEPKSALTLPKGELSKPGHPSSGILLGLLAVAVVAAAGAFVYSPWSPWSREKETPAVMPAAVTPPVVSPPVVSPPAVAPVDAAPGFAPVTIDAAPPPPPERAAPARKKPRPRRPPPRDDDVFEERH